VGIASRDASRERPNAELKEVKEGKRDSNPWMTSAIAFFLQSETVVGLNKTARTDWRFSSFLGKHLLRRASVGI
jgi:hypothetical protein